MSSRGSVASARARLERMLAEQDARNADNVSRTESYLELYALTREHPPELPWLLMAHLVSRNAGHMMTELAVELDGGRRRRGSVFAPRALEALFLLLERANFLIFDDAWRHVHHHLLGRGEAAPEGHVARFMQHAWRAYEGAGPVTAEVERRLVLDLVTNEQNYIERRVVHSPRFEAPRAIIAFLEAIGREAPIELPPSSARILVGGFAALERRIAAGTRIFDEVLAARGARDAMFSWARERPHTGSRRLAGGLDGPKLRDAWPVHRVRALWNGVHAPTEPDPFWP